MAVIVVTVPTVFVIDDTRCGFNASDVKVGMMTALNHHDVNFVKATISEATLDNAVGIMTTLLWVPADR